MVVLCLKHVLNPVFLPTELCDVRPSQEPVKVEETHACYFIALIIKATRLVSPGKCLIFWIMNRVGEVTTAGNSTCVVCFSRKSQTNLWGLTQHETHRITCSGPQNERLSGEEMAPSSTSSLTGPERGCAPRGWSWCLMYEAELEH